MSRDGKIAWLTVGTVIFGFWAAIFCFSIGIAFVTLFLEGGFRGGFDAIGAGVLLFTFLIFVLLPAFAARKCFKASRRLGRERLGKFVSKDAFE